HANLLPSPPRRASDLSRCYRPRKKPPCRAASKILAVSLLALDRRTSAAARSGRPTPRTAATGRRLLRLREAQVGVTAFSDSYSHASDERETMLNGDRRSKTLSHEMFRTATGSILFLHYSP